MRGPRSSDLEACAAFARRLERRRPIEAVVLFGSRARGEALEDSDFDLIVVSDALADLARRERLRVLGDLWIDALRERAAPVRSGEVHGYTRAEALGMEKPLVWDALESGVVLLDRGTWSRARELYEGLKRSAAIVAWPDRGGWTLDLDRIRAAAREAEGKLGKKTGEGFYRY